MKNQFAQVIFSIPLNKSFDYAVPEALQPEISIGKRVLVPFGGGKKIGFVVGLSPTTNILQTKEIIKIIDKEEIFDQEYIALSKWLAEYYLCSWGEALDAVLPQKTALPKKFKTTFQEISDSSEPILLTAEQQKAAEIIKDKINQNQFYPILLRGITDQAKIQIYAQAIDTCIAQNKKVLFLVPEISLIKQYVGQLATNQQEKIAIVHSGLSAGQKYDIWKKIKSGQINLIIGTRLAVFSPVKKLGLIIIEDEHDQSYKQDQKPMYHTREVALKRAEFHQACIILSSTAPSLESYYAAKKGKFTLVELPERIGETPPQVQIIDMRQEKIGRIKPILSYPLIQEIQNQLANKNRVILFVNRRGFSTHVYCRECGWVIKCPKCNLPVVYNQAKNLLQCHYCNWREKFTPVCPACKRETIDYYGTGTQKVEEQVKKIFSQALIRRVDLDTLTARKKLSKIDFDILIGTQVITKGLILPEVSLVGVLMVDMMLNLPDFRSAERTFGLLKQLIDLIKGKRLPAKIIVQSYQPDNYCLQAIKNCDYLEFYNKEMAFREELKYPPLAHLAKIIIRGMKDKKVEETSQDIMTRLLKLQKDKFRRKMEIFTPALATYHKLRGKYRWQIVLKAKNVQDLQNILKEVALDKYPGDVHVSIDLDPLTM